MPGKGKKSWWPELLLIGLVAAIVAIILWIATIAAWKIATGIAVAFFIASAICCWLGRLKIDIFQEGPKATWE